MPCPICHHPTVTPRITRNGYTLAECAACHALHVSPMPSDDDLRAHYQNPAYFEGEESQGYRNYADMEKALRPHFARRLNRLGQHFASPGALLDFGCAAGFFLDMAQTRGWRVHGVELSTDMARAASQRLNQPIATALAESPARQLEAITLWEVIEHLPRPVETVRELADRLRPGGALMLSTPNTGHWQAVHQPEQWSSYRPPSHLQFFTRATLADTLRRAGLERIEILGTLPLPRLPGWLQRATAGLQYRLANGQSAQWAVDLWAWRGIRALALAFSAFERPAPDTATTLEALAFKPR